MKKDVIDKIDIYKIKKSEELLKYYKDWLLQDEKIIVSGDINNSVLWDRRDNTNNFKNINQKLNEFNFFSAYHHFTKENFGEDCYIEFQKF